MCSGWSSPVSWLANPSVDRTAKILIDTARPYTGLPDSQGNCPGSQLLAAVTRDERKIDFGVPQKKCDLIRPVVGIDRHRRDAERVERQRASRIEC